MAPDTRWETVEPRLSDSLISALHSSGFQRMTPVQTATVPLLLSHKDTVVEAVTGSGKTLAFLVPLIEILIKKNATDPLSASAVGALVISPTKELALQTFETLERLLTASDSTLSRKALIGGSCEEETTESTEESANILVCTPGRLERSLTKRGLSARVKTLEILVLDEADRLLDIGFRETVMTILNYLPRQRRTGLFSATLTERLEDLTRAGLRNPIVVSVKEKTSSNAPETLENFYCVVEPEDKLAALLTFIKQRKVKKALFFLPTCACVDYWSSILPKLISNLKLYAIHGKMKKKRNATVETFRAADNAILLCTDVMARGIDIPCVEWVFMWEPPSNAAVLVHRAGRTARAGEPGKCLLPLLPTEESYVEFISRNQNVELKKIELNAVHEENRKKIMTSIRSFQLKDRSLYDKAVRAFVSHVRAYSKHECSLLFRVKDLPLGLVANSYGLLKLPKMPELTEQHKNEFIEPQHQIDFNNIPYVDKQKEASRQKKLVVFKATGQWLNKDSKKRCVKTTPWSIIKQSKADKIERRQERKGKKQEKAKLQAETGGVKKSKKKKVQMTKEEMEELLKDVKLCKKLKKKKITQEEFDEEFGLCEDEN